MEQIVTQNSEFRFPIVVTLFPLNRIEAILEEVVSSI
ncbi:ribonuclease Z [Sporosarcina globispora]|uniref:Ribonuclease Z n=1 Tax=Sporosarcina globispora TaxID=1459 RepID=A0A0M0G8M5_SPOGL|nr:ribonuclease Z [Sporosarcina globispora]KON86255.1 ribonuclease Z [Sporosarcina globispora]